MINYCTDVEFSTVITGSAFKKQDKGLLKHTRVSSYSSISLGSFFHSGDNLKCD